MTMSDEDGNGSILCLRENYRADFEGKDDNVFVNKWLDDNLSNHQNRWTSAPHFTKQADCYAATLSVTIGKCLLPAKLLTCSTSRVPSLP